MTSCQDKLTGITKLCTFYLEHCDCCKEGEWSSTLQGTLGCTCVSGDIREKMLDILRAPEAPAGDDAYENSRCKVCLTGNDGDCGVCSSMSRDMAGHIGRRIAELRAKLAAPEAPETPAPSEPVHHEWHTKVGSIGYVNVHMLCFSCGHSAIEHEDFSGPCNFIKWVGGRPEYRCMCTKFAVQPPATPEEGK